MLCATCASVHARCALCRVARRLETHRAANAKYGRSLRGLELGRVRQQRFRGRQGRVTDPISTQAPPSPTSSSSPSRPTEGPAREQKGGAREVEPKDRRVVSVRCAACGRVLSGLVQPSERSPRRRRRAPRHGWS